jgi:hypothetical protein
VLSILLIVLFKEAAPAMIVVCYVIFCLLDNTLFNAKQIEGATE